MSKKQILSAIRVSARKLGRAPTSAELHRQTGIRNADIRQHFSGITEAIHATGLKTRFRGPEVTTGDLLADWARTARKLRRVPTTAQYRRLGRYAINTFLHRFGAWQFVPDRFNQYIRTARREGQWRDVLELVAENARANEAKANFHLAPEHFQDEAMLLANRKIFFKDRPVLGASLHPRHHLVPGLLYEPTNEAGVLFVFAAIAHRLGFEVESIQAGFPDCLARRQIRPGRWQRVRIELEFESRSFLGHRHDPKGCDIIVCWRHNWKKCPKEIEVIELAPIVMGGRF